MFLFHSPLPAGTSFSLCLDHGAVQAVFKEKIQKLNPAKDFVAPAEFTLFKGLFIVCNALNGKIEFTRDDLPAQVCFFAFLRFPLSVFVLFVCMCLYTISHFVCCCAELNRRPFHRWSTYRT